MKKYYVAMIINEETLHDLENAFGGKYEIIGEPLEINNEFLEKVKEVSDGDKSYETI